jgi:NADP-dependent 3-hydroxy acid dehydrogenase YdfG
MQRRILQWLRSGSLREAETDWGGTSPRATPAAGDNVVAGARRTEELAPLVAQCGERVKPVTLEVRDEAAAKAAVQLAVDTFGLLDVLVNNAGYGQIAPFEQISAEDFQAVVDTCFYGVVYSTRPAVPVMHKQKSGHIFRVSSVGGRLAIGGNTPYHAAKWAVGGFSDALATKVAPVRGEGLHLGAGRHSDQLGAARGAECAGVSGSELFAVKDRGLVRTNSNY